MVCVLERVAVYIIVLDINRGGVLVLPAGVMILPRSTRRRFATRRRVRGDFFAS